MSDEAVEQAFDVIAPLLASFGCKQPFLSKYNFAWPAAVRLWFTVEAAFRWREGEHSFFGRATNKMEIKASEFEYIAIEYPHVDVCV